MNPNTGELIRYRSDEEPPRGFLRIAAGLQPLARLQFQRDDHPAVNMRSCHPLANWARTKAKKKLKGKIAAASRRRNRK